MLPPTDELIARLTQQMLAPVVAQVAALRSADRNDEALDAAMKALQAMSHKAVLAEYTATLRRLQRSSEKLNPLQLELIANAVQDEALNEPVDPDEGVADLDVEDLLKKAEDQAKADRPPRKRGGRNTLPDHLDRVVRVLDVAEHDKACPCCGSERVEIGRDEREVLDVLPIRFRVLRYERVRRACRDCGRSGVVTGPPASDQLERLMASPRLLAHVATSKYEAHLPLHRLRRLYKHMGLAIAESTLGGWVARVAEELRPVHQALWDELRAQHVVGTDATGLRVLDTDAPSNVTLGTVWCYVGYPADLGTRLCAYRYSPTGTGKDGPWTHLEGQTGFVQADAANVFDRLFNGKVASATEVGCWAHARRKLRDLLDSDKRVAKPLQRIARIYRVDKAAKANGMTPDQRLELRQRVSKKHVDWLQRWLQRTRGREPPKSALGKACAYWTNHWEALTRFLHDGRLELDNTEVERQLRALALGRKNYLFAGSHDSADRAAVIYSLIRSCDLAGIDAMDWMESVLTRLAAGWPQKRIDELLPHRWTR